MKRALFEYIPAGLLLAVFGLIVLHAPFIVFIGTRFPELALVVKAWKEVLIVIALLLVGADILRRRFVGRFARDRLLWLMVGYVFLHIIFIMISPGGALSVLSALAIDLRYVLYFIAVYLFLSMYPRYIRFFVNTGVAGAIVVVGFAVLQQFLPKDILVHLGYSEQTITPYLTVDKNPDYVRINSTLRGPNPLGAYALVIITGVVALIGLRWRKLVTKRRSFAALLFVGSVVALWTSYSRSAVAGALLSLGAVFVARFGYRLSTRQWLAVVGGILIISSVGYLVRDSSFVHNVILHDNPSTGANIDSNTAHFDSLTDGFRRMTRQPLGGGVGSTGSASLFGAKPLVIENQYLFVAHETGWVGFGLFIAIFGMILARLWQVRKNWLALTAFASGIGLAVVGLMLPVWVDDTVAIVWWGLAAIALAKGGNDERATNKKAA